MSTLTTDVSVAGMTCEHCIRSVQEELGELPGVTDVHVDLVPGGSSHVTITSTEPLSDGAINDAVVEAGYTVAPPRSLL